MATTIEELRVQMEQMKQFALRMLEQLMIAGGNEQKAAADALARDKQIVQDHLEEEERMSKAGTLSRRAAKREKAVDEMSHKQRVKELAEHAANYSVLVYKAERNKEEYDQRIKALLSKIVETEQQKYAEETEIDRVLKDLQKDLQELKTDPRQISKLWAAGKADNIRRWARINATLQKLEVLEQDSFLKQGKLERMRAEVLPLLKQETDTDAKITKLLAWLRDVEDQERLVEEEDAEKLSKGTETVAEMEQEAA